MGSKKERKERKGKEFSDPNDPSGYFVVFLIGAFGRVSDSNDDIGNRDDTGDNDPNVWKAQYGK